jgi:hypothetical protein
METRVTSTLVFVLGWLGRLGLPMGVGSRGGYVALLFDG